uniref:Reverse transcriptase domain-containing protein n=1 Tax=Nicotiana tabacum TaxID=4097 RepID=A0A1S3YQ75_TOBAC|nr:PREDICTED: uncharacterized protein LOC107778457 [Nicotiana tabacum]
MEIGWNVKMIWLLLWNSTRENVPGMVTMEQNLELCKYPTLEEVEFVVFELSGEPAAISSTRLRCKPTNVVIKLDMAKEYDRGFGMPQWTNPLNHLAYDDDTIIFASAHPDSLEKIMAVLCDYEKISGQLINKPKSSYYMHSNVATTLVLIVGDITGFAKGAFPFIYLGCTIFYTSKRKDYYDDLIKKTKAKLHSWKEKLLYYGGKATLICSVPKSMAVHLLSILDPPKNILEHLHKLFSRFFWSNKEAGRSRH